MVSVVLWECRGMNELTDGELVRSQIEHLTAEDVLAAVVVVVMVKERKRGAKNDRIDAMRR